MESATKIKSLHNGGDTNRILDDRDERRPRFADDVRELAPTNTSTSESGIHNTTVSALDERSSDSSRVSDLPRNDEGSWEASEHPDQAVIIPSAAPPNPKGCGCSLM